MRERHYMRIDGVHERDLRAGDWVPGIGEVKAVHPVHGVMYAGLGGRWLRPRATVMVLRLVEMIG